MNNAWMFYVILVLYIEIRGHTKKSDQNYKKRLKDYCHWERLEELELRALLERRTRGDLTENFEENNGIFNYGRHFFRYVSSNWRFTDKTDFKN